MTESKSVTTAREIHAEYVKRLKIAEWRLEIARADLADAQATVDYFVARDALDELGARP